MFVKVINIIIIHVNESTYMSRVFDIQQLNCTIFQFLDIKSLSRCRSVAQRWLYDGQSPFCIYHINVSEMTKCIQYIHEDKCGKRRTLDKLLPTQYCTISRLFACAKSETSGIYERNVTFVTDKDNHHNNNISNRGLNIETLRLIKFEDNSQTDICVSTFGMS